MIIYGLQIKGARVLDLKSACAEVVVQGFTSQLAIKLTYTNKSDNGLEATYVCPVDAKAAVYSFEAKVDGRLIKAHCLEKKQAQEAYKNAVKQGHTAILGSKYENAGDVIQLALGNIPAGVRVELHLKMVMELTVSVDGAVTFKLPTVFNPRHSPAAEQNRFQSSGTCNNVYSNLCKYSLDIKGEVRGSFKIARVTSESDPINVQITDEETAALITQDGGSTFDHDWSFQVYYQTVHKAQCLQMEGDRSSTGLMKDDILMLNFFPEIPSQGFSPQNELMFIVDRSRSMQGNKIVQAKNTLLLFLKSLPPGCRFNIISFGSTFSPLFYSASERYTEQTLKKALELQKSMDADMGGTEIFRALEYVYFKELTPGYPRQIIVLTDGEAWNQGQIFDLISRHADEIRLFSVGIGHGASTALVQGMAEAGRGRCEMVIHDNQLPIKVMGLVANMLQEKAKYLQVDCEVNPSQALLLVPKIPPVIFGGQHLILYARVIPKSEIKSVKITWKIGDKEMNCKITEEGCKIVHDSNFSLHRLAAKAQLKQWELEDTERKEEDLVALSVSSNVVCSATSFVGIDQDRKIIKEKRVEEEYNNASEFRRRVQRCISKVVAPRRLRSKQVKRGRKYFRAGYSRSSMFSKFNISYTSTYHCYASAKSPSKGLSLPPQFRAFMKKLFLKKEVKSNVSSDEEGKGSECAEETGSIIVSEEKEEENECADELLLIVSSQNFDGSWNLSDCCKFVNCLEDDQVKKMQSQLSMDDTCLATVLSLALLELKFAPRKQEWHFVSLKGRMFLKANNVHDADALIKAASKQLRNIHEPAKQRSNYK